MMNHLTILLLSFFIPAILSSPLHADSLDNIAKQISKVSNQIKNKRIAVLPFPYHDGKESRGSTIISERLITKIVSRGKLQVVERALLEKVFNELKLQYTGMISQESAKRIGNILGVEAILTGTLIDLGDNEIEVNARLINSESGLVLTAAGEKMTKIWQETSQEKKEPEQKNIFQNQESASQEQDDETRKKMSTYFHSREWKDPRLDDGQTPAGTRNAAQNQPIVLSNKTETAGSMEDDLIMDPPEELFNSSFSDENESKEINLFGEVWQKMKRKDYETAIPILNALKEQSDRPRISALARLYSAEIHLLWGNYRQAVDEVRPVLKSDFMPKLKVYALYIAARSFDAMGKRGVAANLYREIVQRYPFENRLIKASGYRLRR